MNEASPNQEPKSPNQLAAELRLRLETYLVGAGDELGYVPMLAADRLRRYCGEGDPQQQVGKLKRILPLLEARAQTDILTYFSGFTQGVLDRAAFYYPVSLKKLEALGQAYPALGIARTETDHSAEYDEQIAMLASRVERKTGLSKPPSAYQYGGTVEADEAYDGLSTKASDEQYHRMVGTMVFKAASIEYPVAAVRRQPSPIPREILLKRHPLLIRPEDMR